MTAKLTLNALSVFFMKSWLSRNGTANIEAEQLDGETYFECIERIFRERLNERLADAEIIDVSKYYWGLAPVVKQVNRTIERSGYCHLLFVS